MKNTEQTWIIFRLAKIWRRKIAIWGSIYLNFVVRRLHCIKYVLLIIILERVGQQKERKLLVKDWLCKRINYKIFRELWFLLLFLLWIDLSNLTEKTRLQMSNDNRLITWNTLWKLVAYLDWQTSQISLQEEKKSFSVISSKDSVLIVWVIDNFRSRTLKCDLSCCPSMKKIKEQEWQK